ncbi:MAG: DUF1684 domain-containing protein [Cyclobacteriaceae bacterium]|nr:DUF1684 domain-containing protein [Cyclobacteriaceae bacterium]
MAKIFTTIFIFSLLSLELRAQSDSEREILKFQKELNEEYSNPKTSPLPKKNVKKFEGHDFFPVDLKYRVKAMLSLTPDAVFFKMQTSTNQPRDHRIYAMASFSINENKYELPLYQSSDLMKTEEYKDYLFLPFTDLTNGEETYPSGRYIGLRIPKEGNEIIIDFNQAYNPYCAYSSSYSCPIVPRENDLNVAILAGVKFQKKK